MARARRLPTRTTIRLALVTAVYSRLRCSISQALVVTGPNGTARTTGLAARVDVLYPDFAFDHLEIETLGGDDVVTDKLPDGIIQLFVDGIAFTFGIRPPARIAFLYERYRSGIPAQLTVRPNGRKGALFSSKK